MRERRAARVRLWRRERQSASKKCLESIPSASHDDEEPDFQVYNGWLPVHELGHA
jgi:hypothetical protein